MSECVVRMEMPGSCLECQFFNKVGCKASGMMFPDWLNVAVRPKGCPILAVLPEKHGRLVEADGLAEKIDAARIRVMQNGGDTNPYWECGDIILQAKTIVPATEGGKE